MRSTAQRLGDVTLVLAGVAALTLTARLVGAVDVADGHASTFWSYLGLSIIGVLLPAFAGACLIGWMDEGRRRYARWALLSVFVAAALVVVCDVVMGKDNFNLSGGRGAAYLQDAASLLMVAGGLTLVLGMAPRRDRVEEPAGT